MLDVEGEQNGKVGNSLQSGKVVWWTIFENQSGANSNWQLAEKLGPKPRGRGIDLDEPYANRGTFAQTYATGRSGMPSAEVYANLG